ncbi:MAG: hypothetical protein IKU68_01075 [Oscillospiraceae bacterium]|nr:hypothetical protein [Oscillospiraceae bacterium]
MAQFQIRIAGTVFSVESLFDSTKDYCRNYLTEDTPEFRITVSRQELADEQEIYAEEARQEGWKKRTFTDPFLERSVIQRKAADHLFRENVLMLHGSTVAVDGRAYLFTAACGTGKSTHTRYWREVFGSRAMMVNDDKPFLRITEAGVLACGSPWSGKHGLDSNITVPLAGICLLTRGPENRIRRAQPEELMPMLLHQSHCPAGQENALEALVSALAARVPLWHMECAKDPRAAVIAHDAMSQIR